MLADSVPSPCNQICRLDPHSGLCVGCLRTGTEIGAWSSLPPAAKRALLERLAARRHGV